MILTRQERGKGYVHAEKLHVFIDELLRSTKKSIDAIAVSAGPGSYTGLRIGVSAAKGLAFGHDIPLISIQTLDHFAHEQKTQYPGKAHYIPLIDARRMEVYCNVYRSDGTAMSATHAHILNNDSFREALDKGPTLLFGDASQKAAEVIQHPNAEFVHDLWPSAEGMAAIAFQKYSDQRFEDLARFEPFYLKDFIAGQPKKLL